jgi:hypothetical protein
MCPDGELLSAYYDDELDPQWDKQIAEHVLGCRSCSQKLASFSALSEELQEIEAPDFEASRLHGWDALQAKRGVQRTTIWTRRISVPLPAIAAVAAAFAVVVAAGLFFSMSRSAGGTNQAPAVASTQQDIAPVNFQVNNLADLRSYLDSKDFGNNVTIQLPKGMDRLSAGKPQLMRAADFKRGQ